MEAYYKRLMDPDPKIHMPAAQAFTKYDFSCAFLKPDPAFLAKILQDERTLLGIARMFAYYCKQKFFLKENELIQNLLKIYHLPGHIVHGRYDTICRASSAYELHQRWPGSQLVFVQDAGHSAMEPGIAKALMEGAERLKDYKVAP
jgi:proline iminopeptidase